MFPSHDLEGESNGYYSEKVDHGSLFRDDNDWYYVLKHDSQSKTYSNNSSTLLTLLREAIYNKNCKVADILVKGEDDPIIRQYYEDHIGEALSDF